MSNPNKVLLGLLGAAAVGVVVGMLLAPEKGGEVRQKIADKASDIASKLGDYIATGKDKITEAGQNLAGKARGYGEEAIRRGEQARNSMS